MNFVNLFIIFAWRVTQVVWLVCDCVVGGNKWCWQNGISINKDILGRQCCWMRRDFMSMSFMVTFSAFYKWSYGKWEIFFTIWYWSLLWVITDHFPDMDSHKNDTIVLILQSTFVWLMESFNLCRSSMNSAVAIRRLLDVFVWWWKSLKNALKLVLWSLQWFVTFKD